MNAAAQSQGTVNIRTAEIRAVREHDSPHMFVLNNASLADGPTKILFSVAGNVYEIPATRAPFDVANLGISKDTYLNSDAFLRGRQNGFLTLLDTDSVLEAMRNSDEMREEMELASRRVTSADVADFLNQVQATDDGTLQLDFRSKPRGSIIQERKELREQLDKVPGPIRAMAADICAAVSSGMWTEDADKQACSKLQRTNLDNGSATYLLSKLPEAAKRCREYTARQLSV